MPFCNTKPAVDCPFCKRGFKVDTFLVCPHCGLKLPANMALKDHPPDGSVKPESRMRRVKKFISQ